MTYNFNQMWEPQLFDQTLDDSEIGGTAWNVMFFCVVFLLKFQLIRKWAN